MKIRVEVEIPDELNCLHCELKKYKHEWCELFAIVLELEYAKSKPIIKPCPACLEARERAKENK